MLAPAVYYVSVPTHSMQDGLSSAQVRVNRSIEETPSEPEAQAGQGSEQAPALDRRSACAAAAERAQLSTSKASQQSSAPTNNACDSSPVKHSLQAKAAKLTKLVEISVCSCSSTRDFKIRNQGRDIFLQLLGRSGRRPLGLQNLMLLSGTCKSWV